MSTDDLEATLASLGAPITESKAVSVEWPLLKPDWLFSRSGGCSVRKVDLVEHDLS